MSGHTKEVVHVTGSALAVTPEQEDWNAAQVAALKQLGLNNATDADLAVYHHVCQKTGLDPFARQIHMLERRSKDDNDRWVSKWTIQTGIDGFRLIARRAADRAKETLEYEDTEWCGRDGQWVTAWLSTSPPAAARVTVLRNGKRFSAVAVYAEYVQLKKDGNPVAMWLKMPANQLAKCAEALALRKAYPQDLSGIYTDDEMGQADVVPGTVVEQEQPTGLAAALAQRAAEPELDPIAVQRGVLLGQIKAAAETLKIDTATIAQEWADAHDGERIIETTDIGALELLCDDLTAQAKGDGEPAERGESA